MNKKQKINQKRSKGGRGGKPNGILSALAIDDLATALLIAACCHCRLLLHAARITTPCCCLARVVISEIRISDLALSASLPIAGLLSRFGANFSFILFLVFLHPKSSIGRKPRVRFSLSVYFLYTSSLKPE